MLSRVAWGRSRGATGRLTALLATVGLVFSLAGCTEGDGSSGTDGPDAAGDATATSTPTVPPSPSERLGLAEGWGPDRSELDRAATSWGACDFRAGWRGDLAKRQGTAAPVQLVRDLDRVVSSRFDANVASAAQVAGVNARLTSRCGAGGGLPGRRPGGWCRRAVRGCDPVPAFTSAVQPTTRALTWRAYAASGAELRGLGFTVDFAPTPT